MVQQIMDESTYSGLSNIQKGFFDGYRKAMIMLFDDGSHDFAQEIVQLCETSAYVFIGELSDETLNPEDYFPVLPPADGSAGTGTV